MSSMEALAPEVSATEDREPHRVGAGGAPHEGGHGSVAASAAARAVLEAGAAVDGAELSLTSSFESENDEGTAYMSDSHALSFRGEPVWSFGTSSSANIGGSRGTSSSCSIEGNQLVVKLEHLSRTVMTADSREEHGYLLSDLLIRAAVMAGATEPEQPGRAWPTIRVQPATYRVLRKAAIRCGIESDSRSTGSHDPGDVITAQEHGTSSAGVPRLRTERGWISNKPEIVERTALTTAVKLLALAKLLHPRLASPHALQRFHGLFISSSTRCTMVDLDVIEEIARRLPLVPLARKLFL